MNYQEMAQSIRNERRLLWEAAGRPRYKLISSDPRQQSLHLMMALGCYPWSDFTKPKYTEIWNEDPWMADPRKA